MQKIHVTKKILSVLLAVVLLCAVLPARVTGEEPALFRVALLYSDTTNAEGGSVKVALKLVPSRFMRKIVCRLRLSEVSRQ